MISSVVFIGMVASDAVRTFLVLSRHFLYYTSEQSRSEYSDVTWYTFLLLHGKFNFHVTVIIQSPVVPISSIPDTIKQSYIKLINVAKSMCGYIF